MMFNNLGCSWQYRPVVDRNIFTSNISDIGVKFHIKQNVKMFDYISSFGIIIITQFPIKFILIYILECLYMYSND